MVVNQKPGETGSVQVRVSGSLDLMELKAEIFGILKLSIWDIYIPIRIYIIRNRFAL